MKKKFLFSLKTISRLLPLNLYSSIMHRDVIDFFWHAVSDEPMPHVCHLYPVVSATDFEASLIYLKQNFNLISYAQLHAHVFLGTPLPPKSVHISFDDGYAECFKVVRPILLKHEIPCTFFITTDLIDNNILFYRNKQSLCVDRLSEPSFNFQSSDFYDLSYSRHPLSPPSTLSEFIVWLKDLRLPEESLIDEICHILNIEWHTFLIEKQPYLTTAQIRQMRAEGFTIGAHTLSHRKLVDLSDHEIEIEITQSCQVIGEITGQEIVPFSFPNSAWGLDRDYLKTIRDQHKTIGLLFDTKGVHQDVDFIQNRIWVERPLPFLPRGEIGAQMIREHLYIAYQEAWVDEIMKKGRKLQH